MATLREQEPQLVAAQKDRIKDNYVQAFLWMAGNGDGSEAADLARNRGAQDAVGKVMTEKGCWNATQASAAANAAGSSQPAGAQLNGTAEGEDTFQAENFAKSHGCSAQPRAVLNAKGPGFETYSVGCSNGDVLSIRCSWGNCRALQ